MTIIVPEKLVSAGKSIVANVLSDDTIVVSVTDAGKQDFSDMATATLDCPQAYDELDPKEWAGLKRQFAKCRDATCFRIRTSCPETAVADIRDAIELAKSGNAMSALARMDILNVALIDEYEDDENGETTLYFQVHRSLVDDPDAVFGTVALTFPSCDDGAMPEPDDCGAMISPTIEEPYIDEQGRETAVFVDTDWSDINLPYEAIDILLAVARQYFRN